VSHQFLKHHLLDLEVAAALIIAAVAHFYAAFGLISSILLGLTAFVLILLLVPCWSQARALFIVRRFKD
jgi:hypothetical protein